MKQCQRLFIKEKEKEKDGISYKHMDEEQSLEDKLSLYKGRCILSNMY